MSTDNKAALEALDQLDFYCYGSSPKQQAALATIRAALSKQGSLADLRGQVEALTRERDHHHAAMTMLLDLGSDATHEDIQRVAAQNRTDLDEARATIKRLNRRATDAEAVAMDNIDGLKAKGMPLGRRLAHVGYGIMERERDAALAEVKALRARPERVVEVDVCLENKCPYLDIGDGQDGACKLAPILGAEHPDMSGDEIPALCPLRAGPVLVRLRGGK